MFIHRQLLTLFIVFLTLCLFKINESSGCLIHFIDYLVFNVQILYLLIFAIAISDLFILTQFLNLVNNFFNFFKIILFLKTKNCRATIVAYLVYHLFLTLSILF